MSRAENSVIIDTSFLVALLNEKDELHNIAKRTDSQILGEDYDWISTPLVAQELFWLLRERCGADTACLGLDVMAKAVNLPQMPNDWMSRCVGVLHKYHDQRLDLTDASLAVLGEHLGVNTIVTADHRDFSVLRWSDGKTAFTNLFPRS